MNLLDQFISILSAQKPTPSRATVKNYKADIAKFLRWYENTFGTFSPSGVTYQTLKAYKATMTAQTNTQEGLALRSVERHLSSLRKFFNFLVVAGQLQESPFEILRDAQDDRVKRGFAPEKDPYRLQEFRNYLYVGKSSDLTIKNYIMDVKQFFAWAEKVLRLEELHEVSQRNIFKHINTSLVEEYKNRLHHEAGLSPVSINRKLSSLRRYLSFAKGEGLIQKTQNTQYTGISEVQNIRNSESDSSESLNHRLSDSQSFPSLLENLGSKHIKTDQDSSADDQVIRKPRYSKIPPVRLFQRFGHVLSLAFEASIIAPLAGLALKLHLLGWQLGGGKVFAPQGEKLINKFLGSSRLTLHPSPLPGNFKKEFFAPHAISLAGLPLHKRLWHHARHTRPKWYKRYHENPITHYFHFAILMIVMTALGFGMYQAFVHDPAKKPVAAAGAPPRILSFQGRLTDASDNPITTAATPLRFAIYYDLTASGSALLWQEIVSVSPDADGIFSVLLGNNTTIPQSLFGNNASLYLGITVQQTPELAPRQQIATVPYATNAELLQGLPPITQSGAGTTNVVLALNSSGNLAIGGSATPVFQATGGSFTLQGTTTIISTTTGSGGNVIIAPDGLGKVDLQKPLQNSTNSNNIGTAIGSVEVDDLFSVLATSSGQSAVTINQNGTGPLLSASASGSPVFTVANSGALTSAAYTNAGGILYTATTGLIGQTAVGTATQCLLGGGTPAFGFCPGAYWDQQNGSLYPLNSTVDLLVGGQSTASANFAVLNNNSGIPVASVSGNFIVMPKNGGGGNIGVGTTTPAGALHVVGHCVTGDTLLKRRRRKKKRFSEDSDLPENLTIRSSESQTDRLSEYSEFSDYEDVRIDEIEIGDEILTLDEHTGKFVDQKVEKLMDMGVQQTYEIITETGKRIRTTAEHPYLVYQEKENLNSLQKDSFEYTERNARKFYFENLAGRKVYSPIFKEDINFTEEGWNHFVEKSRSINELITRFFALPRIAAVLAKTTVKPIYEKRVKPNLTAEYWVFDDIVEQVAVRVVVCSIDKKPKFFLSCTWLGTKEERGIEANKKELSLARILTGRRRRLVTSQLFNRLTLPENPKNVKWIKVSGLKIGQKIATVNGWERILSLKKIAREQTFDIQVANTHNFVGNDIVAHNTYIMSGNVGIGITAPLALLHVGTGGTPSIAAAGDGYFQNDLEVDGALNTASTVTFTTFTTNGGLLYTNGSGVVAQTNTGTASQCLLGGGTPAFGFCPGAYWDQQNGSLYPLNSTVDLLIGGQSTASAKFAVINMNTGTPTASISANSGNIATYLTGDGTLATTNRQTLTIGNSSTYNTTGNLLIHPNGTGNVGIGTTAPGAKLEVVGGSIRTDTDLYAGDLYLGYDDASATITTNDTDENLTIDPNGTGTITLTTATLTLSGTTTITASSLDTLTSAATLGVSATTLNLGGGAAATIGTISDDNLSLSPNGTGDIRLVNDGDTDIIMPGFTSNGGPLYTNGSGVVAQTTAGTASQCLLGGTSPSFGSCGAGGDNYWNQTNGSLFPNNSTVDLLIGGQSTASAKFAFINVNSGNPTATISGNLALAVPTTAGANTLDLLNNSTLNIRTSQGGDAGATTALFIASRGAGGNVGVGTTTPAGALHVVGHCVTGDTLLKRRRRRRKSKARNSKLETNSNDLNLNDKNVSDFDIRNSDFEEYYEDVRIDEIEIGDEILTLDEHTGKFVDQKVEKLMDMGVQEVFRLITQSGKIIETTDEHPYLVLDESRQTKIKSIKSGIFQVDQSPKIETLTKNSVVAIANKHQAFTLTINRRLKKQLFNQSYANSPKLFGPEIFAYAIVELLSKSKAAVSRLEIDIDYPGSFYEMRIASIIRKSYPSTDIHFVKVGKHSPAHLASYLTQTKRKVQKTKKEETLANSILKGFLASELLHQAFTRIRSPHGLFLKENYTTNWVKVKYLKPGMTIATMDGWEKISKKYPTGHKLTYDIQVANTHNFVANDIVAHNTYIMSGNVGIGTTAPTSLLNASGSGSSTDIGHFDIDIDNSAVLTGGSNLVTINLNQTASNWARIGFADQTDGTISSGIYGYFTDHTNNYGDIAFITRSASGLSEKMRILSTGNVGIGDSTPNARLEVGDGTDELQVSSVGDITFVDADGAASITGPAGGALGIAAANSQALNLTTTTAGNISLDPAGAGDIAFTLDSSGSVFTITDSGNTTTNTAALTASAITTGKILNVATSGNTWTGNSTTTGLVNIASTSTAGTASDSDILLNIARSGANANTAHTAYGIYSAVTNTNATSGTNVAGYFSASGATTNNYALSTGGTVASATDSKLVSFGGDMQLTSNYQSLVKVSSNINPGSASTASFTDLKVVPYTSSTNFGSGSTITGISSEPYLDISTATTVTNVRGLYTRNYAAQANTTISNSYGLYVANPDSTGTITTNYGIYLEDQTGGDTTDYGVYIAGADSFALYSADSGAPSYFAGNIGIGITAPLALLHVGTGGTPSIAAAGDGYFQNDLEVDGALNTASTVTFTTFTSNGGPLYTNGSGVLAQTTAGTASQCLLGGTTPSFGSCGAGGDNYWNQANGALFPNNSTVDLLIGGQSTASAKFAVLNVNNGTPTASVSAGTGTTGGAYITAAGLLATTNMQTLAIGTTTTGNINIGTDATARILTLGNVTGATAVNINSGTGSIALASTSTGDITLNSSDTVLIDAVGVLELNSSAGVINIGNDAVAQNINIGNGAAARTITIGNITGATAVNLNAGTGGSTITTTGAGDFTVESGDDVVINGAGASAAISIGTAGVAHTIIIGNETGATSLELDSGTGSIAIGNAIAKTIAIGNSTGATGITLTSGTGNVAINTSQLFVKQADGNVGIGTNAPTALLHVAGAGGVYNTTPTDLFKLYNSSTTAASNSAQMSFYANRNGGITTAIASISAVLADNSALGYNGDLVFSTANVANVPAPRMIINGFGNVGIGTTTPGSILEVGSGVIGSEFSGNAITVSHTGGKSSVGVGQSSTARGRISWTYNATEANSYLVVGDSLGTHPLILQDQGGNVGIGTATPTSFVLQVAGSIGPNADDSTDLGSNSLRWRDIYLGPASIHIGTSTTDEGTISYDTSGNILNFGTDSTTNADIAFFTDDLYLDKSSGFVGIGDTAPSTALEVNGTITGSTFADYQNSAYFLDPAATGTSMAVAGNVGIGTTTPGFNLQVNATTNGKGAFGITGDGNQTLFTASASGSTKFLIDNGGNVGIGTTAPLDKVEITTADTAGTEKIALSLNSADFASTVGDALTLAWRDGTAGGNTVRAKIQDVITSANHNMAFFTTTSSVMGERMRIQGDGNVGIGTTTPGNKLMVQAARDVYALNITSPDVALNSYTGIKFTQENGNYQYGAIQTYGVAANGGGKMIFSTGLVDGGGYGVLTQRMTIDSGGNVGIGTTAPGGTLQVAGGTASSGHGIGIFMTAQAGAASSNGGNVIINSGANGSGGANGHIIFAPGGTITTTAPGSTTGEIMRITGAGNVGIGTTAPTSRLTVLGSGAGIAEIGTSGHAADYTSISLNGTGNTTTGYNILSSTTDQNLYLNRPTGLEIKFRLANADQMILSAAGNLGIGTTAPDSLLHVSASAVNTGAHIGASFVGVWNGGTTYSVFTHNTIRATTGSYAVIQGSGGDTYLNSASGQYVHLRTNNGAISNTDVAGYLCYGSSSTQVTWATSCNVSTGTRKHDILSLDEASGLSELLKLRPVSFVYNAEVQGGDDQQVGFIAEEVEAIDQRLVIYGTNGKIQSFKYENFTAILTKAVQQLNQKVESNNNAAELSIATVSAQLATLSSVILNSFQDLNQVQDDNEMLKQTLANVGINEADCTNQKTTLSDGFDVLSPVEVANLSSGNTVPQDSNFVNNQNGSGDEGSRTPESELDRFTSLPGTPTPYSLCKKINALVNLYASHSALMKPLALSSTDFVVIASNSAAIPGREFVAMDSFGKVYNNAAAYSQAVIANLRVGGLTASKIFTDQLEISTDAITIGNESIRDYIVRVVQEAGFLNSQTTLTSPIAQIDRVYTNALSPLPTGNGAITIDGNLAVSGNLSATDASFSGTLRARNIIADNIEGLNATIATLAAHTITNITNVYNSTPSGSIYADEDASHSALLASLGLLDQQNNFSSTSANLGTLIADFGTFNQGLLALGPSSFTDVAVTGQMSVGQLILADNTINTLGGSLEIQPLRQGDVRFMGGLVQINTDGDLQVGGDAEFVKNVRINGKLIGSIISPIPDEDLVIELGTDGLGDSRFIVKNATGSAVFSVNQAGDISASGSASFTKLNFNLIKPAIATGAGDLISFDAVGVATISATRSEITIHNSMVTEKSLIYLTPVGETLTQPVYLMRQVPGQSFTVGGLAGAIFNWLIIN